MPSPERPELDESNHPKTDTLTEKDLKDAARLFSQLRLSAEGQSNHPQFRSQLFAAWRDPPLPVEIFAGFHLRTAGRWNAVTLHSREAVMIAGRTLFTPSVAELHGLLLSFARPKDLERARTLVAR